MVKARARVVRLVEVARADARIASSKLSRGEKKNFFFFLSFVVKERERFFLGNGPNQRKQEKDGLD